MRRYGRQNPIHNKCTQDREPLREQRMWREAYHSLRRPANKYARLLHGACIFAAAGGGFVVLLLAGLAVVFGADAVVEAMGGPEFLYGIVGRGAILFIAALIAGYLVADWSDD